MPTEESPPTPDNKTNRLIFNRYRLGKSLGKGSFGEVFHAEDIQFEPPRQVALKLLHPHYVSETQVREDLKREASTLARFNHPNILRVIDFGITEEIGFIVTDLATGGSLADKLRPDPAHAARPMPLEQVAHFLDQLADALDDAHGQGLVHRDIKPQNILLDGRGRPLLADFGLATAVSASSSSLLVTTTPSGTPLYMAPEQWQGQAGRASDIYALGAVVYQMATGQPPYQGSQFELMGQHLSAPVPRLSDRAPGLRYPPALDEILKAALAKDPRSRLRPAGELARRFRAALNLPASIQPEASPTTPPWKPSEDGTIPLSYQPGYQPSSQPVRSSQPHSSSHPLYPAPPRVGSASGSGGLPGPAFSGGLPRPPEARFSQPPPQMSFPPMGMPQAYQFQPRVSFLNQKRNFYTHLVVYGVIITFLWLIWLMDGKSSLWPIYPTLGWGLGLAFQAASVFVYHPDLAAPRLFGKPNPDRKTLAFYKHLSSYVLVITFLWLMWIFSGFGFPWPIYPTLGWGIGIAAHTAGLLLAPGRPGQSEGVKSKISR